jgi:hypothetical protein
VTKPRWFYCIFRSNCAGCHGLIRECVAAPYSLFVALGEQPQNREAIWPLDPQDLVVHARRHDLVDFRRGKRTGNDSLLVKGRQPVTAD